MVTYMKSTHESVTLCGYDIYSTLGALDIGNTKPSTVHHRIANGACDLDGVM